MLNSRGKSRRNRLVMVPASPVEAVCVALRNDEGLILCKFLLCVTSPAWEVTDGSQNLFIGNCSSDQLGNAILQLPGKQVFLQGY